MQKKRLLMKLDDMKDEIEGCCFSIQQTIIPRIKGNKKLVNQINLECSVIDQLMSELESIIENKKD